MLVRFTPKQIYKLKDFLKSCKLNAYDIGIYQEILNNLDHAVDEKPGAKSSFTPQNRESRTPRYDGADPNISERVFDKSRSAAMLNPAEPVQQTSRVVQSQSLPVHHPVESHSTYVEQAQHELKEKSQIVVNEIIIDNKDLQNNIPKVDQPSSIPSQPSRVDAPEQGGLFQVITRTGNSTDYI